MVVRRIPGDLRELAIDAVQVQQLLGHGHRWGAPDSRGRSEPELPGSCRICFRAIWVVAKMPKHLLGCDEPVVIQIVEAEVG